MSTVMISAKFPTDLVESLRDRARESDRTLSAELRHAVRMHLTTSEAAPPGGSAKTRGTARDRGRV